MNHDDGHTGKTSSKTGLFGTITVKKKTILIIYNIQLNTFAADYELFVVKTC